jgi:hypothetical protein
MSKLCVRRFVAGLVLVRLALSRCAWCEPFGPGPRQVAEALLVSPLLTRRRPSCSSDGRALDRSQ